MSGKKTKRVPNCRISPWNQQDRNSVRHAEPLHGLNKEQLVNVLALLLELLTRIFWSLELSHCRVDPFNR